MHALVIPFVFLTTSAVQRATIRLEAEIGRLVHTTIASGRSGYSGKGYVTGFVAADAEVVLDFEAPAGVYEASVRYSAPNGQKGFGLKVNGAETSGMFSGTGEHFATVSAGKVELKAGHNTIELTRGWGYFDVDYVELRPATINTKLSKPPFRPVDPDASPEVRALFETLLRQYGSKTLSGQYDDADTEYIELMTRRTPAIYGDDFMDYSPSRVAFESKPPKDTENAVRHHALGQIVTMSWHWNAPTDLLNKKVRDAQGKDLDASWYKGFYTYATTFDIARALSEPGSERYRLLLRDIDAIAFQLKRLADAKIPVLWRPLHEAQGGWFGWGAKGPGPFVKLWRLLYDRLTKVHHLHNLIWVFTVGDDPKWYPGDAYVDVLGVDAYPADHSDPLSSTWEHLKRQFDGKKLLALTEFGGVPDVPRMTRFGVEWSYFVSWPGQIKPPDTTVEDLRRIYQNSRVGNKK